MPFNDNYKYAECRRLLADKGRKIQYGYSKKIKRMFSISRLVQRIKRLDFACIMVQLHPGTGE